jgi:hypothetical protein
MNELKKLSNPKNVKMIGIVVGIIAVLLFLRNRQPDQTIIIQSPGDMSYKTVGQSNIPAVIVTASTPSNTGTPSVPRVPVPSPYPGKTVPVPIHPETRNGVPISGNGGFNAGNLLKRIFGG